MAPRNVNVLVRFLKHVLVLGHLLGRQGELRPEETGQGSDPAFFQVMMVDKKAFPKF